MTRTEAERLTRIETLLEADVNLRANERATMLEKFNDMAADVKAIKDDMADVKAELSADKADLAALKNKGWGIIAGAAIAGGAGWEALKAMIGSVFK